MARKKKEGTLATSQGMYRLNIREADGTVVEDSGWRKNMVMSYPILAILTELGGGGAMLEDVTHMALGSAGAFTFASNVQPSVHTNLISLTSSLVNSTNDSSAVAMTLNFIAEFPQSHFSTGTVTIQNVGLWTASVTSSGNLYAGAVYSSSTVAANQIVTATYGLSLGQA